MALMIVMSSLVMALHLLWCKTVMPMIYMMVLMAVMSKLSMMVLLNMMSVVFLSNMMAVGPQYLIICRCDGHSIELLCCSIEIKRSSDKRFGPC